MVSYRRMKCGYRAFLRRFIIPQPFENRLAHSAALGLFHIFDGTYEHRGEPHRVLISRRIRKRRSLAHGNCFDPPEILTADAKRNIPATDKSALCPTTILPSHLPSVDRFLTMPSPEGSHFAIRWFSSFLREYAPQNSGRDCFRLDLKQVHVTPHSFPLSVQHNTTKLHIYLVFWRKIFL